MVASRVGAGKKQDVEEKWEEIGFHKPLGQFWWNYLLTIIMALASLIFTSVLIPNFILPFPETFGYYSVATAFFTLLFTILNNGTSDVVTRYISEHAVDNPRKTLEYIRFFIWFQMITGLVQVTGIALFSLYLMPDNLSYMKWVFIIYSTIQFPGMLTVYQGCLNGFQRFDKSNMLQIFQTALIQPLVLIGCVLVFKNLGAMYPGYGEMMGSLIGYVIGNYLDDFITFSISAKMFAPVLKKIGYSLRDTLIPRVSMDVVKNALFFGTKMMVTGMLYQLVHFFVNIMIINWVPQYGTILGIYGIAKSICDITLMQLP
ncbi:oligosaccharide flippase family protein, partial [Candidatus Bathyarchaeota archaeon]|nr:oligosaccharide flippase family protein [Candidatus Bathyarchaeota archaeon]